VKHPILRFLAVVVLPSAIVMWGSERAATAAQGEIRHESALRTARLAIGTLNQYPEADTEASSPSRAAAEAALEAVALVGRMTGARIAIFADGSLLGATDSAPALASLTPGQLGDAADSPVGHAIGAGALLVMGSTTRESAILSAYAEPIPSAPLVPSGLRIVMALLLVLPSLTCWLLMLRARGGMSRRKRDRAAVLLLAAVPVVASIVLAIQVGRDFERAASTLLARDLTRSLAVVEALDVSGSPESVHAMSGFPTVLVTDGAVEASTLDSPAPAVAALPDPPPSFTTSGLVETRAGLSQYVSRRLTPNSFVTILAPPPSDTLGRLRSRTNWLMIGLALWLALAAGTFLPRKSESS